MKKDIILLVAVVLIVNNALSSTAMYQETLRRSPREPQAEGSHTAESIAYDRFDRIEKEREQAEILETQALKTSAEQRRRLANALTRLADANEKKKEHLSRIAKALESLEKVINAGFQQLSAARKKQ